MFYSIRARIIAITVTTLLVVVGLTATIASSMFYREHTEALKSTAAVIAQNQGEQFARLLEYRIPSHGNFEYDEQTAAILEAYDEVSYAAIVSPQGKILAASGPPVPLLSEIEWSRGRGPDASRRVPQLLSVGSQLVAVHPIIRTSGYLVAWSVVALPLATAEEKAEELVLTQVAAAAGALLIGLLLLLVTTTRWIDRPLNSLLRAIRSLRASPHHSPRPIAAAGEGPLGEIAEEFNAMAATLRQTTVSRDYMGHILSGMSEALFVVDGDKRIERTNPAAARLIGSRESEIVGTSLLELVRMPEQQMSRDGALACDDTSFEAELRCRDGEVIPLLLSCSVLGRDQSGTRQYVITGHDLRERKRVEEKRLRLEQQLKEAERLQTVGRLAGGVSHEFNNIITGVLGYCDLMRGEAEENPVLSGYIESVVSLSTRATQISRQLLSFSRARAITLRYLDMNRVVRETAPMLRTILGEKIDLTLDIPELPLWVRADRGEIEQILLNLALNGRDAMPHGGTLQIITQHLKPAESGDDAVEQEEAEPASIGRVALDVVDNGIGMDEETLSHVFEPFFTTKEVGKGTGLGLPAVYGVVSQHGGSISVQSAPDEGAAFHIELPEFPAPSPLKESSETVASSLEAGKLPSRVERARVLVVEDEPQLRELIKHFLTGSGYEIHTASTAEEALRRADGLESLTLILTDVIIPDMSGPALVERLQERSPAMKSVFMSGYPRDEIRRQEGFSDSVELIEKPFRPDQLTRRVAELLAR